MADTSFIYTLYNIQFTTVLTKNKDILYSRNIDHVSRHLYPYDNNFCINKHIYPSALCQVQKYSIEIGIDRQQQMFGDFKQIDVLFHFLTFWKGESMDGRHFFMVICCVLLA